jgi:hypothetical protein
MQGKCWRSYNPPNALMSVSLLELETLPLLRHISLLQVLRVLITQLEVGIPYRLLYPLFAAQTDDRANTLLDCPCCCDACHADVVPLRNLLDTADDLLVDLVFAAVDKVLEELVGLRTAG